MTEGQKIVSQEANERTESQWWKWYWDVRRQEEPLDEELEEMWGSYDYILNNQKFVNNKSV